MTAIPNEQQRNYIIKVTTPAVTYRWTPSRARTSDGRIGLVVAGEFYEKANVTVPLIDISAEAVAQSEVSFTIGSADTGKDDLVFDYANLEAEVRISIIKFGDDWNIDTVETWFSGRVALPSMDGDAITIACYAESGRRRGTGARKSQAKLTSHTTLPRGAKVLMIDQQ